METFVVDMVNLGAVVDAKDRDGRTPLHLSAARGDVHMVETLLKLGADPNSRNKHDDTPMYVAAFWGHAQVIKLLVRYGADGTLQNDEGKTPVAIAIETGRSEAVVRAAAAERCCDVNDAARAAGFVAKSAKKALSRLGCFFSKKSSA